MSDDNGVTRDNNWLRVGDGKKTKMVPYPERNDVEIAEKFLSEPEVTRMLATGIARVSECVQMIQESGLTEEAICLLIQDQMPNLRNGKKLDRKTISNVLMTAANLDRLLVDKPARKKSK